jgi:hypothetical protein
MCNLVVLASYFLYENFYNIFTEYENLSEKSLEMIVHEQNKKENHNKKSLNQDISLSLLYYYSQFCNQKHLKFTPDSFSKFVFHTM